MADCVPFRAGHMRAMKVQPSQVEHAKYTGEENFVRLEKTRALTVIDGSEVLACFGMIEVWPGRALLWAFFAQGIGHRMIAVIRRGREFLAEHAVRRYEMDVRADHDEGHRLAQILGFSVECARAPMFYPDGMAATLYSKVTSWQPE